MSDAITVDLGPENGRHTFRTLDQLLKWVEREKAKWDWMPQGEPGNSANRLASRFDQLANQIRQWTAQGQPLSVWADNLPPFFHPDPQGIVLIDSPMGRQICEVRDASSDFGGAVAHSALREWAVMAQMDRLETLRPFLLAVMPGLIGPDSISATLKRERANTANQLRKITADAELAEENRAAAWITMLEAARGRAVSWTRTMVVKWDRRRRSANGEQDAAIEAIKGVTLAYNEFMRLQAPANYWRDKATRHGGAEKKARDLLFMFFPAALVVLGVAFFITAGILLRPGPAHPTPVYFVVSAGLATFAGVVFWIGRLLTRLYLSEHHLRKDAEEREVMTTTYLALTRDQAADEKDRHIILTALFRNSADGIVKDDGGAGTDLPSLIARTGIGR